MSEVNPEARTVLNDSLGMVAANIIYRTLDGLADPPSKVCPFTPSPDGIESEVIEEELPKPKDYDKAINTALKVLAFFSFTALDTEFDEETAAKAEELKNRLPNQRRKRNKKEADNAKHSNRNTS